MRGAKYDLPEIAYFATVRCASGAAPFRDKRKAALMMETILRVRELTAIRLWAFCVMPDHLHLVLSPPELEPSLALSNIVRRMKSFATRSLRASGWRGPLWQRSFYDRILRRADDLATVCSYAVENPVRKGMVDDWLDYPFAGIPDL